MAESQRPCLRDLEIPGKIRQVEVKAPVGGCHQREGPGFLKADSGRMGTSHVASLKSGKLDSDE